MRLAPTTDGHVRRNRLSAAAAAVRHRKDKKVRAGSVVPPAARICLVRRGVGTHWQPGNPEKRVRFFHPSRERERRKITLSRFPLDLCIYREPRDPWARSGFSSRRKGRRSLSLSLSLQPPTRLYRVLTSCCATLSRFVPPRAPALWAIRLSLCVSLDRANFLSARADLSFSVFIRDGGSRKESALGDLLRIASIQLCLGIL